MKNKLVVVGLIISIAGLGPFRAQADEGRSGKNAHGDFVTVSVERTSKIEPFSHHSIVDAIVEASKEMLDGKAIEACSGRDFSIDDSSIEYTTRLSLEGFTVKMAARVFCIN